MKTLVTPLQALRLAFPEGEALPPGTVAEADIAAAEQRYIVPVIGRALHARLLEGAYETFRTDYLAAPTALFTRLQLQPRLDIRTGQCGTTAPKSSWGQRALRTEARTLLRRAAEHLDAHRTEFPEYDPTENILKRCSTDGGFVQMR